MNDKVRPIIVFADDDRDICELVQMQLTRHGFEVFITDNGETALELVSKHQPAVALLDIMMPKLSGLEVVRRIPLHNDACAVRSRGALGLVG